MLSTSTSTSTYVPSGTSTSMSTSTEIRYSNTTSTSTKYSGPNPGVRPSLACSPSHCRTWGHFKNVYELINLGALKSSLLNKQHIFQCMGKIFCVEFQRVPKFHTKYLTHTLKDMILCNVENLLVPSRDSPAQKMYVPKGHAAQIFMCLYAFLCAFLIKSIKVNKSLHI